VIAVVSLFLGVTFMTVFETAIDTIFLSFCEDCERNDGSDGKPYYMPPSLRTVINAKNKVAPEGDKEGAA
jgi:hypothetical protein